MRRLTLFLLAALLVQLLAPVATAAPQLPPASVWRADVKDVMAGSVTYLEKRKERAGPGAKLALNLDIDNSMVATQYAPGTAMGPVLALVKKARRLGVAVFVNTARKASLRDETLEELAAAGYRIDGICMRARSVTAAESKPRCRARFRQQGFVLVANVGNNDTDFAGGGYEKAYRLPNYDGQLA